MRHTTSRENTRSPREGGSVASPETAKSEWVLTASFVSSHLTVLELLPFPRKAHFAHSREVDDVWTILQVIRSQKEGFSKVKLRENYPVLFLKTYIAPHGFGESSQTA